MQLKLYIDVKNDILSLPLNYNHIMQGIIYSSLTNDKNYQAFLHDTGIDETSHYKYFTFSSLCGKHYIEDKKIFFTDKIFFEIRSVDSYFIFLLYEYFKNNGITFGNKTYKPNLVIKNKIIRNNSISIKMNSPICISKKEENGNSIYLTPRDSDFNDYINKNFIKKYTTFYNSEPVSKIEIIDTFISPNDKIVTTLKGIYITAWKGSYILLGSPNCLTFLYNCGLGVKNSQGFGLFELIEEE